MAGRFSSAPAANSAAFASPSPPTPPAAPTASFGTVSNARVGTMAPSFVTQQPFTLLPSTPLAASGVSSLSIADPAPTLLGSGSAFKAESSFGKAPERGHSQSFAGQSIFQAQSSFGAPPKAVSVSQSPVDLRIFETPPAGSVLHAQDSLVYSAPATVASQPRVVHTPGSFVEPSRKDEALQPLLKQPAYVADLYGSAQPVMAGATKAQPNPSQRRRADFTSVASAFFMPWVLFSALYALRSFSFHYEHPLLTRLIAGLGLVVVIVGGVVAVKARCQLLATREDLEEPSWGIFIFAACLLAWVLAMVAGDVNYYGNMQPFYDILNLNTYPAVDPSQTSGQQVMDAGRIVFSENARLDVHKAMAFKNLDTYCVAPITVTGKSGAETVPLAAYDFWAVGINCCAGNGDFRCGEFNNPHAHAGLRLMTDEQRPFFRLAVQQAEATLGIKARHPIFLHWLQDPSSEVNAYREEGFRYYLLGTFGHFALQLLLVATSAFVFFSRAA